MSIAAAPLSLQIQLCLPMSCSPNGSLVLKLKGVADMLAGLAVVAGRSDPH
jgi:hypothetical protein